MFHSAKLGDVLLPAMDNWNNPFKSKCYLQQGPGRAGLGAWGQERVTPPNDYNWYTPFNILPHLSSLLYLHLFNIQQIYIEWQSLF